MREYLQRSQGVQEDHGDPWDPVDEDQEKNHQILLFLSYLNRNFLHILVIKVKRSYHWAGLGWAAGFGLVNVAHLRREVLQGEVIRREINH